MTESTDMQENRDKETGLTGFQAEAGEESEGERLRRASEVLGIEVRDNLLSDLAFEDTLGIPIQYYRRMGLVPLAAQDGVLTVALSDPMQFRAADDLALRAGCRATRLVISPEEEIHEAINLLFDRSSGDAERMVEDLEASGEEEGFGDLEELEDLMETTHEAPVIRVVNGILTQALRRRASDIHVEPYEREIKVRFPHRRNPSRDHDPSQAVPRPPGEPGEGHGRPWTSRKNACPRTAA